MLSKFGGKKIILVVALILVLAGAAYTVVRQDLFGIGIDMHNRHRVIRKAILKGEYGKARIYASNRLKEDIRYLRSGNRYNSLNRANRLVVYNVAGGVGDLFTAKRVQAAAWEMGWELLLVDLGLKARKFKKAKKLVRFNHDVVDLLQPDFVISHHAVGTVEGIPHYLALHSPNEQNFEKLGDIFANYSGLLLAYDSDYLEDALDKALGSNKDKMDRIQLYLSLSKKDSKYKPLEFRRIFYSGVMWDQRRSSKDFKYLYRRLDEEGIVNFYGPEKEWKDDYPDSYIAYLPFNVTVFLQAMQSNGIALVAHSAEHYRSDVPTSRIFEAAASSSVIISDDLGFVKKHFGDSVLYFDPDVRGKDLYLQVKAHYDWIMSHPEEAAEMAKRANQIFNEKFTLEKQLINIENLYLKQMAEKKSN